MSSGSSVTINVIVGGTPDDFTYQWFRNGILIAGETDSTLTIPSISTTDIGIYTCTPNNSRGSTNSSGTTISVASKSEKIIKNIILFIRFFVSIWNESTAYFKLCSSCLQWIYHLTQQFKNNTDRFRRFDH